ncbi:DUF1552 domain-containing protein [Stieleria varia]|uniref:Secreted protein containing DUF1552 n=1 Tax=Stieleria varia TaxID=2528005 RepID=A0A5C6AP31_9BACT|nr:DUF1552 domain-containing protein [Stieleria varia]TWU01181.1 hypothetical protein Pla52n_45530 [Stieleria varia]
MNHSRKNSSRKTLARRTLLRGTGVAMSLPWLSAMTSAAASATDVDGSRPGETSEGTPRRFVSVSLGLGLLAENLNPEQAGRDYKPALYLEPLADIRDQFTVVSGSSHPGVKGGHRAEASILTGCAMGSSGSAKNTVSLDQHLAKHLGDATRFPSLVLNIGGDSSPSYTENGAMIPPYDSPADVFAKLFIDDSKQQQLQQAQRVRKGRSIMDMVGDDAKRLQRELGTGDRDRLDAYFTSVRELEQRMAANERWAKLPKPKVDAKQPLDIANGADIVGRQRMMMDVMRLALQTDSTRFITLHIPGVGGTIPIPGVEEGYHTLSHHGMDQDKLDQLALIEAEIVKGWGNFVRELHGVEETDGTLLEHTSVLLTSNLGNASNHDNRNMPVLFAGGGFRHGQHLAFDKRNNYPLTNLFVSVLQQTGLETDTFATGTSTMTGLEPA